MENNKILFSEKNRTKFVLKFHQIGHEMSHISVEDTIWARDDLEREFKSVGAKMICFSQEILSRKILTSKKIGVAKRTKVGVFNAFCIKDLVKIKSILVKELLYNISSKIHKINSSKRIIIAYL